MNSTIPQVIHPFIGDDMSHPKTTAVGVKGKYAYATDGRCMVRVLARSIGDNLKDGHYDLLKVGKEYILRPCERDLGQLINYDLVAAPTQADFGFEFHNDIKTTGTRNKSELIFNLAQNGICIDWALLKTLPISENFKVSGLRNSKKPVIFEATESKNLLAEAEFKAWVMPYRAADQAPADPERAELLEVVKLVRNAVLILPKSKQLDAITKALGADAAKDLVRRAEGRV